MNVPKLRFKEFNGEWEITCLKDVITRINRVSDDFAPSMMITADSGFVLQSEKYSKDMTGESLKKYITLFKGELAYNHGASKLRPYGSTFVLNEERAKVPFVYHCFAINKGITDFYGLYLNRWEFGKKLKPLISSSARLDGLLNISFESFTNIKVNTPNFTEQEKIADFLNLVGEKINIQKDIVVSLEKQKKGLMQKIFSQKLRFKDDKGEEFPDWEEKKLGEVVEFLDERRVPLKDSDRIKRQGRYPYYGASGIIDYIDDFLFDEQLILLGEDGANIINRTTRLAFIAEGKYWVNNHAHVLKGKPFINQYYLCEYLESLDYAQYNSGTAQPKLNQDICKKIKVVVPCLDEQIKIATFLENLDVKIIFEKTCLKHWQQIKKGLLQQMFV